MIRRKRKKERKLRRMTFGQGQFEHEGKKNADLTPSFSATVK
jgi:hypothetical protein